MTVAEAIKELRNQFREYEFGDGRKEAISMALTALKEKEPAPSVNDTSSKPYNISFANYTAKDRFCQALYRAAINIISDYGQMSAESQRNFNLGEAYAILCNTYEELTKGE